MDPNLDISRYALCKQVLIDSLGCNDLVTLIYMVYSQVVFDTSRMASWQRTDPATKVELASESVYMCPNCRRYNTNLKITALASIGRELSYTTIICYHVTCYIKQCGPIHVFDVSKHNWR